MRKFRVVNKGQMLIEIVVAIGIIGLVLVGVSDLMTRSMSVASFQKQRDGALQQIQKMMIDYKISRDSNPEAFYLAASDALLDPCEPGSVYRCEVRMTQSADHQSVNVTVMAEWDDGGKTFSAELGQSFARTIK